ncbi:hypothetical protein BG000_007329 [Podila horticola]|nr:hypothetical protein BG000_007329 [Podila horticola]
MRTWMRKIYCPKTRNTMILAMHKRTRLGCEDVIKKAIKSCKVPDVVQYIHRQWALWARQHSPLLLQVTTTNPLESYHSEELATKSSRSITAGKLGL